MQSSVSYLPARKRNTRRNHDVRHDCGRRVDTRSLAGTEYALADAVRVGAYQGPKSDMVV